jgi:hypothetical protein
LHHGFSATAAIDDYVGIWWQELRDAGKTALDEETDLLNTVPFETWLIPSSMVARREEVSPGKTS